MAKFNAAFWKWFGDSKVVDAKGEPLVVYHGTPGELRGDTFELSEAKGVPMFFFTPSKRYAKHYTRGFDEGRVVPVYLRLENPIPHTEAGHRLVLSFIAEGKARGVDWPIVAQEHGYDGKYIFKKIEIAVFSPTQIKSATSNRGTWSRTDPNIRRNPDPGYRKPGDRVYFEYHCFESPESSDAELWFRSHQRVTVLKLTERGGGDTKRERCANGEPAAYDVQFADGFIGTAVEDELVSSRTQFFRPDPPRRSERNPRVHITFPVRTLPVPPKLLRDAETVRRRVMKKFLSRPREMQLRWYCTTVAEAAYDEFLKLGYSHRPRDRKAVWTESTGHHYVVVRYGGREYIVDLWTIGRGQEHRIAPIARVWDAKDPTLLKDASYERQVWQNSAVQWVEAPGRRSATVGGVSFNIRHVGPLKSMYWLYANNSRVQWPLGGGYADSVNFSTPGAAKKFVEQNLKALLAHYGQRIRRNPMTWKGIKALGVKLDCYLTSRRDPFARQAYADTVDPESFAEGEEWYLGDGGYSRMIMRHDGTLALTDNSIRPTRAKWNDPEALRLRKAIEEGMRTLYGEAFEPEKNPRRAYTDKFLSSGGS